MRQFEAATRVNHWTTTEKALTLTLALRSEATPTDALQTLCSQEEEDYNLLGEELKMRYGQTHLVPLTLC